MIRSLIRPFTKPASILWFVSLTTLFGCTAPELGFEEEGTAQLVVGDRFRNPTINGNDTLDFRSTNTAVATVDDNGEVTAMAAGQAYIVATQSLGERTDTARFSVEVIDRDATLSAWVGTSRSRLLPSAGLNGVEIAAASDPNCNFNQVIGCDGGQTLLARSGSLLNTTATTLQQPGYFQLNFGGRQVKAGLSAHRFPGRYDHDAVAFNNQLWIVGGRDNDGNDLADIWSSADGLSWVKHDSTKPPPARHGHQLVVFQNNLLLIGGGNGDTVENDVWTSKNGIDWTELNANATFSNRAFHQVAVFTPQGTADPVLWLIGGVDVDGNRFSDVYSSTDGNNWTDRTNDLQSSDSTVDIADFLPGLEHQLVVFNDGSTGNKLWLFSGLAEDDDDDGADTSNEIWSSPNGITWTLETNQADFSARYSHQVAVRNHDGKQRLWLVSGDNGVGNSVLWWSDDGVIWHQEKLLAEFSGRYGHRLVAFNDRLWLLAGYDGSVQDDVWASADGVSWQEQTLDADFGAREQHQAVAFDGQLWVIGGSNNGLPNNEVWSSADGLVWTQQISEQDTTFTARDGHQVIVFDNALWLVGGYDAAGQYLNDVWTSSNGIDWELKTDDPGFEPRAGHQLVVFKGLLWLVGGYATVIDDEGNTVQTLVRDEWSTRDGVTWINETTVENDFTLTARQGHQVVVWKGQPWLFGGETEDGVVADIWVANDGNNWESRAFAKDDNDETKELAFTARSEHQVVAFKDQLWLLGGTDNDGAENADIWVSDSGFEWTLVTTPAGGFSPRQGHQLLTFDDGNDERLVLIGGYGNSDYKNDVWSSTDGTNWQKGLSADIHFPNR
ncbi:Ig-like domain-containing protein [Saccharospirillum mangrovi]|uniref:Kelch repeat-containing protein n=1 Tax=Saccharospirillum mangrovi TaxID=2161747 RepID=UPI000D3D4576|nr:Ig-like domain-containing protein [Saccharospirillum mangrovi]